MLLGVYVSPDGRHWDEGGVAALERGLGRGLALDHRFKHWDDPFPTTADRWDHAHGRIPMITWEPDTTTLAAIASGADDALHPHRGPTPSRATAARCSSASPTR